MPTTLEKRVIRTSDGECPVHLAPAERSNPGPAVIVFMDAGGVRPLFFEMAERLAREGYTAAVPDLYYRSGPYVPIDVQVAFVPGPERDRFAKMAQLVTATGIERDVGAVLDLLEAEGATAIGCTGYCFGGRCALIAAGAHGARLAAAASIHGARLATDAPDSPHLRAPSIRAEVYVALAERDPYFDAAERLRLTAALEAAGVPHTIEVYEGVAHGFAVPDNPSYDPQAAERHWDRILSLFRRTLR